MSSLVPVAAALARRLQGAALLAGATLASVAFLALPSAASAGTVHCGNLSASNVYDVVGGAVSCGTARAVAKAEVHALLTPGAGAKHYIAVNGKHWHYTWHDVSTGSSTQVEYYKARSGSQSVTFQTHGSN